MHDELCRQQQWHHDEEANVRLQVQQKRHRDVRGEQISLEGREHQKRYPGDQHEYDHAPRHQTHPGAREVRAQQKLEQRTAVNQGEILGVPQKVRALFGCS